ncbi:unnamed protein product [Phaedon cochleariae]|uniref:Protein CDV3 homolog n=1 Tax=Phaedon cochleariae TaxID=80249 RepID=A0A9N9S904_PHACE|nr:unnamed protein product [Phaedon cochleariae]
MNDITNSLLEQIPSYKFPFVSLQANPGPQIDVGVGAEGYPMLHSSPSSTKTKKKMADLDDFFAKKDRKKSKTTKKFATTEEVAKKLEDTARKTEKQKKERVPEGEVDSSAPIHEQDEWKDFEEEKKDYTGLKIGNLAITANSDGNQSAKEPNSEDSKEDEMGQEMEKKSGPWKRIDPNEVQEEVVVVKEKRPEPTPAPSESKSSYVAPRLRSTPGGGGGQQVAPLRHRSKVAPDIHNEESFPGLSKTGDYKRNRSEGAFEVVQQNRSTSYRQAEQSKLNSAQGPKLSLGNRYNSLSNDS